MFALFVIILLVVIVIIIFVFVLIVGILQLPFYLVGESAVLLGLPLGVQALSLVGQCLVEIRLGSCRVCLPILTIQFLVAFAFLAEFGGCLAVLLGQSHVLFEQRFRRRLFRWRFDDRRFLHRRLLDRRFEYRGFFHRRLLDRRFDHRRLLHGWLFNRRFDYRRLWEPLFETFPVVRGIHVCGNMQWDHLLDAEIDIVSFDASTFDITKYYGERGEARIAWGIEAPEDVRDFRPGT